MTQEEQQAAARAELLPGDLDRAVNVLQKLLAKGSDCLNITHLRTRKGVITCIEFSTSTRRSLDFLDLVELNDNTAMARIYYEYHFFRPDSDVCNVTSCTASWLNDLEELFGNARIRRLEALLAD